MPRAQSDLNSPYTFVKGLITEANRLSESENSMVDGANVSINRDGSCERRLGLDVETSGDEVVEILFADTTVVTIARSWKNVNGDATKNFCVVQIGTFVYFFDFGVTPLSDGYIGFFDMSPFCISTTSASQEPIQLSETNSALVIVNKYCDPLWVVYDSVADTISASTIKLKFRDFEGLPDALKVSERPTAISTLHYYNLLNQGWGASTLSTGVDNTGSGVPSGGAAAGGGGVDGFGTEIVATVQP